MYIQRSLDGNETTKADGSPGEPFLRPCPATFLNPALITDISLQYRSYLEKLTTGDKREKAFSFLPVIR